MKIPPSTMEGGILFCPDRKLISCMQINNIAENITRYKKYGYLLFSRQNRVMMNLFQGKRMHREKETREL